MTDQGQLIRMDVSSIRIAGRGAMGVTLFKLSDDASVVSVAHMAAEEEGEEPDADVPADDV